MSPSQKYARAGDKVRVPGLLLSALQRGATEPDCVAAFTCSQNIEDVYVTARVSALQHCYPLRVAPMQRDMLECYQNDRWIQYILKKDVPIPNPPQPTLASPSRRHQD